MKLTGQKESADHLLPKLRSIVGKLAMSGPLSIERVAFQLGTSPRSLQRRLASRHVTFRRVLFSAREEIACILLGETELAVSTIATRMSYRTPGSFARAFARWTGLTPTEYRRRVKLARNGQPDSTGEP